MMDFINQRIHRTDMDHSVDHIEKIGTTRGDGTLQTIYGMFPSDYQVDKLRNLCIKNGGIQTGPFGSQLHQEDYVDEGTPIITVEHLGENRITHNNLPKVSNADKCRLAKYSLEPGDIVFSRVGSVDRRALVRSSEDGWLFSGRCLRVRPDDKKLDSGYLSYFFGIESFKEYIRSIAVGATMPSLNTAILSDMEIPYPKNLTEQRRIAHILGTLDDKIENNRKTAKTLEDMAQAIFQSWFVDFDPVRAKMAGESPESICKRLKLTPEILDLFPDRLVDSELGEIPERWEIKDFSSVSICYDNSRIPLSSNEREKRKGLIPYYGATGIIDYVDQELFDDIYLLLGEDGSVVKPDGTPFIQYIWGKSWVNNHAHVIRGTNSVSTEHLMLFMSTQNITAYVTGAVQLKLNQKNMNRIPFIMAKKDINQYFYLLVADLFSNYRSLNDVSSRLVSCRDTLLPKLISGEVCVPEVEQSTDAIMNGKI